MNWEHKFLAYIQKNLHSEFMNKFMSISSALADNGIIFIVISFFMMITQKYRKIGYACALALAVNAIICNIILKPLIERARPFDKYDTLVSVLENLPKDYSFPSGHTSASFAFATAVFLYDKRLGIACYIFASIVAISRMYLIVHYPTDVITGVFLGVSVAFICTKLYRF